MRFQELHEGLFDYPPAMAKLKKAKSFLSAEVLAKHADLIIDVIALKLDSKSIDELQSKIEGEQSPDDVKFNKDLMLKGLPKETNPTVNKEGDIYGTFIKFDEKFLYTENGKDMIYQLPSQYYWVYFQQARWEVLIKTGWPRNSASRKRFEGADEALAFVNKKHAAAKKEVAAFEKFKADNKAKERMDR